MKINQKKGSSRLISLDVFRGLAVALMILVNSPGNNTPYRWLEHSVWNGCSLADLVFPFFIIIVGISSVLALSGLREKGYGFFQLIKPVIQRSVYIFVIGLLLNVFPNHFHDVSTLRLMGVLQRIAICYFFSGLLFLTTRIQTQVVIMFCLLIFYACLMAGFSLEMDGNLAGYIDGLIFTDAHLYTRHFDPEGLLSTLPAIASVLFGNLVGFCLMLRCKKRNLLWLMMTAGVLFAFWGWGLSVVVPFNKALWSSSFVLWTDGIALLVYMVLYYVIEIKRLTRWSSILILLGRHALLVYVLHVLFLKIQAKIHVHNAIGQVVGFRLYITERLFNFFTPENAALCYSVSYIFLWVLVVYCMKKWKVIA